MQLFTDAAGDPSTDEAVVLDDLVAAAARLRDIGPELNNAIAEATSRIDGLVAADAARQQELAALGAKLNALLDRPEPAAIEIADHLARQDDRLAELHELVDRLHTVTVTARQPSAPVDTEGMRADVSLSLEVLAGLTQRIDQLEGRIDEVLARTGEPPAPDLVPLIVAARELRSDLADRLDAHQTATTDQLRAQHEALAGRLDAGPGEVQLPVDQIVAAVAERTDAGLAAMLRLIDARLERLRQTQPTDLTSPQLLDGIEGLSSSLASIIAQQQELAMVLSELERRQPLVTSESLKRAAASVREAVSIRRR